LASIFWEDKSKIAETLKMDFEPVAILWTDSLPEGALQFKGVGSGCITIKREMRTSLSPGEQAAAR
jgi:hypothetical protein